MHNFIYTFVFNNEKISGLKGLKFSTKMKSEFPGHMHILNNDSFYHLHRFTKFFAAVKGSCVDKLL